MQLRNFGLNSKKTRRKIGRLAEAFLLFPIFIGLFTGCNSSDANQQTNDGATYVAALGSPPADSIAWSPIENKILVTAGDVGMGRAQIYILDINTKQKNILANTNYGDFVASIWAPNDKYVLVLARKDSIGSGAGGLWMLNVGNKSLEYFLDSSYAAWSPDGKSIATISIGDTDSGSGKIVLSLIDINTKVATKIYENTSFKNSFGLSWSSDSQDVAFTLGRDGPGDLYVINIRTKEVKQMTKNVEASDLAWSPSGNVIAYVNWPPHGSRTTLHLLDLVSKCDIQVPNLEYVWSPTWSPDGQRLAFIGADGIYYLEVNKVLGRDIYQNLCP